MFIVGSGLSTLETAANPFIATCGPPRYSELRLTLAQAFQAIGTVVAPVLASQVIFKKVDDTSLTSVQWVYLGIAIFVFLLAIVFFFAPIPEVTDADMAAQAEQSAEDTLYEDRPLRQQYTLFYGVVARKICSTFYYLLKLTCWKNSAMLVLKASGLLPRTPPTPPHHRTRYTNFKHSCLRWVFYKLCGMGKTWHNACYSLQSTRSSTRMFRNRPFHRFRHAKIRQAPSRTHELHQRRRALCLPSHGPERQRSCRINLSGALLRILHLPAHFHSITTRSRQTQ